MAEARTPEVVAHSERVARYTVSLARALGVPAEEITAFESAARFHDIGKMAIPEPLVTKPSPLTSGEIAIMRQHVDVGADILETTGTLRVAAPIVRASHEWFGGGGYPRQLAGDAIPLASRIIAVVDAYDAMTQDRAYRVRFNSADAAPCFPSHLQGWHGMTASQLELPDQPHNHGPCHCSPVVQPRSRDRIRRGIIGRVCCTIQWHLVIGQRRTRRAL